MSFKYAAFTVMMPEYTLEEAAALLKKLKYEGVEWRVHSVPSAPSKGIGLANKATVNFESILQKAEDIKKLSDDHGLEIVGLGTYIGYQHTDDIERGMEAARVMGCRSVRVSTPKYDGTQNYNDLYEEAVDGFEGIEDLAKQYGVRANIELRRDNICCSAGLAYRFVSNFDPDYIGVILDPGNMVCQGFEGWQLSVELLGPYLSYVHVKNSAWVEDGEQDGAKQWKSHVVPLKQGLVDWREVMLALEKVGFTGWLALEDFSSGDTETKLAEDLAYLKAIEGQMI